MLPHHLTRVWPRVGAWEVFVELNKHKLCFDLGSGRAAGCQPGSFRLPSEDSRLLFVSFFLNENGWFCSF